ncbi:hypothetical protein IWQ60_005121 [Tieghemiomyces parasiticus]|uniref:Uncharacterized protein n=1 Tax=Tieghemiomyces parasiticus TaxID=78921 RepID=A0A9W8ACZ1_9FUNG|nr:hypothetical protein IWQ60_005121 [Tieghemiomyces parasiticus]
MEQDHHHTFPTLPGTPLHPTAAAFPARSGTQSRTARSISQSFDDFLHRVQHTAIHRPRPAGARRKGRRAAEHVYHKYASTRAEKFLAAVSHDDLPTVIHYLFPNGSFDHHGTLLASHALANQQRQRQRRESMSSVITNTPESVHSATSSPMVGAAYDIPTPNSVGGTFSSGRHDVSGVVAGGMMTPPPKFEELALDGHGGTPPMPQFPTLTDSSGSLGPGHSPPAFSPHNPASLANVKDEQHRTALHIAAASGNIAMLLLLIRAGADVNARDILGNTPLHIGKLTLRTRGTGMVIRGPSAAARPAAYLDMRKCSPWQAVVAGNLKCVAALLQADADTASCTTAGTRGGVTPLDLARNRLRSIRINERTVLGHWETQEGTTSEASGSPDTPMLPADWSQPRQLFDQTVTNIKLIVQVLQLYAQRSEPARSASHALAAVDHHPSSPHAMVLFKPPGASSPMHPGTVSSPQLSASRLATPPPPFRGSYEHTNQELDQLMAQLSRIDITHGRTGTGSPFPSLGPPLDPLAGGATHAEHTLVSRFTPALASPDLSLPAPAGTVNGAVSVPSADNVAYERELSHILDRLENLLSDF